MIAAWSRPVSKFIVWTSRCNPTSQPALICAPRAKSHAGKFATLANLQRIPIVLGTDAHSTDELRFMEYVVNQAQRVGLKAGNIANTRPLAQFRRMLKH